MTDLYDRLDHLVDDDPIGLRDAAWAEIQRLRAEVASLTTERDRLLLQAGSGEAEIDQLREDLQHVQAERDRLREDYETLNGRACRMIDDLSAKLQAAQALLVEEQRGHEATRALVAEAFDALGRVDCQFWACPGPDVPPVDMATCFVCYLLPKLAAAVDALPSPTPGSDHPSGTSAAPGDVD